MGYLGESLWQILCVLETTTTAGTVLDRMCFLLSFVCMTIDRLPGEPDDGSVLLVGCVTTSFRADSVADAS